MFEFRKQLRLLKLHILSVGFIRQKLNLSNLSFDKNPINPPNKRAAIKRPILSTESNFKKMYRLLAKLLESDVSIIAVITNKNQTINIMKTKTITEFKFILIPIDIKFDFCSSNDALQILFSFLLLL